MSIRQKDEKQKDKIPKKEFYILTSGQFFYSCDVFLLSFFGCQHVHCPVFICTSIALAEHTHSILLPSFFSLKIKQFFGFLFFFFLLQLPRCHCPPASLLSSQNIPIHSSFPLLFCFASNQGQDLVKTSLLIINSSLCNCKSKINLPTYVEKNISRLQQE